MGDNQDRRIGGKIKEYVMRNVGMLGVVLLSLGYTATALITISRTQKTVAQIIVDGATFLLLGVLLTRLFSLQGIMNGERDVRVVKTATLHGQMVEQTEPFIDQLDAWCEMKNAQALKMQRTHILLRNGMKYEHYFNEEGITLGFEAQPFVEPGMPQVPESLSGKEREIWIAREKKKIDLARAKHEKQEAARFHFYEVALRIKLTPLSACALTGEMVKREDPFFFGRSKREYELTSGRQDLFLKILAAVVFGFFSVELLENFSMADLAWKLLQVAMAVAMGLVQMYQSQIYVTEEYRGAIIQKIDHLQMFLSAVRPKRVEQEKDQMRIQEEKDDVNDNDEPRTGNDGAEVHV